MQSWPRTTLAAALAILVGAPGLVAAEPAPGRYADDPAELPSRPAGPRTVPPPWQPITPRVAVIDLVGDEPSAEWMNAFSTDIQHSTTVETIRDPAQIDALLGPVPELDGRQLAEASHALTEARDLLARFDLGAAIAKVDVGEQVLLEAFPTKTATLLYAELEFAKGLAYSGMRSPSSAAQAADAFALTHRLDPKRALDPALYPPDVVAAYAASDLDAHASAKPVTITIVSPFSTNSFDSDADVAQLWLDGHAVGRLPMVATIAAGPHIVVATGIRRITTGQRITVSATAAARIALPASAASAAVQLGRLRRMLADSTSVDERSHAMEHIAKLTNLTDAVIIEHGIEPGAPDALRVQLWRQHAGGFDDGRALPAHPDDHASAMIAVLIPPPTKTEFGPPFFVSPLPPPDRAWWDKRWVQLGFVGGVVAVVTTALIVSNLNTGGERSVTPTLSEGGHP